MWRRYTRYSDENWERRKTYLVRSYFDDEYRLSTIPESSESYSPTPNYAPLVGDGSRGHSPLPDLIIERERKPNLHDESEEFYKKLEVKVKKYIAKLLRGEPSDFSDSYSSPCDVTDEIISDLDTIGYDDDDIRVELDCSAIDATQPDNLKYNDSINNKRNTSNEYTDGLNCFENDKDCDSRENNDSDDCNQTSSERNSVYEFLTLEVVAEVHAGNEETNVLSVSENFNDNVRCLDKHVVVSLILNKSQFRKSFTNDTTQGASAKKSISDKNMEEMLDENVSNEHFDSNISDKSDADNEIEIMRGNLIAIKPNTTRESHEENDSYLGDKDTNTDSDHFTRIRRSFSLPHHDTIETCNNSTSLEERHDDKQNDNASIRVRTSTPIPEYNSDNNEETGTNENLLKAPNIFPTDEGITSPPKRRKILRSHSIQTSNVIGDENSDHNWDELKKQFFVGKPKIFKLCHCRNHKCT